MTKGRPKDPKRARRRTGNRRKPDEAPIVRVVPDLVEEVEGLEAPEHLSPEMQQIWRRLVELIGPARLRSEDAFTIEAMVRQFRRMQQAGEWLESYGIHQESASGAISASAFLKAERDATAMFLRLAENYGLTTASRMRLGLMQLSGASLAQQLSDDLSGG
jgi:P27 family predicted phage terminase small subunit